MPDSTPAQQRASTIAAVRVVASQLLDRARQPSIKEQIAYAVRDLDEAETWLKQPNIDSRPPIMAIVDLNIRSASARLEAMRDALEKYGPDAMLIG